MFKIRKLLRSEINLLKNFPPEDWNINLPEFLSFHYSHSYFYPVVAEVNNKMAGFGQAILFKETAWLGNIIVPPEFRRKGIGYEITYYLVEFLRNKGFKTQILIASDIGKNIYKKLGFIETAVYNFYKGDSEFKSFEISDKIVKIAEDDFYSVKKLDGEISGEKRFNFIERFFPSGLVYKNIDTIEGFFLPDLGAGLIIAKNPEAGLELLKLKLSRSKTKIVIPSENQTAIGFLEKEGYTLHASLPRMALSNDVKWKPELIFNRGAGYSG